MVCSFSISARFRVLGLVIACGILGITRAASPSPEHLEFFESKVRPLLVDHCYPCHSARAEKIKGGLRLDTRAGWEKGGANGPSLVPGKPSESLLLRAVQGTAKDLDPMPPKGEGRRALTPTEIADLERWIALGAPDPRTESASTNNTPDPSRHWAYIPPVLPPRPVLHNNSWPLRELDFHVLHGLESKGLSPSPEADRHTLLRRVTYDLTGLPPTPAEMEAFLSDPDAGAYERVVERLLASPRYGERWGRWWLDVARYADSKGYVFEEERRYAYSYTYRDWVVKAFNRDLPYDRFLIEQIAGDRLATDADPWPRAALGFLTLGRRFLNNEADIIDDRMDVVFRGTQAITIGCARCHDHKSDPIPTADYYSVYGVFASSQEPGEKPLLGDNPDSHRAAEYVVERARREKELADYRAERTADVLRKLRDRVGDYLLCAQESMGADGPKLESAARVKSLDPGLVTAWRSRLETARADNNPIFIPWFALAALGTNDFQANAVKALDSLASKPDPAKPVNPVVLSALRDANATNFPAAAQAFGTALLNADTAWTDAREAARKVGQAEPSQLTEPHREALRALLHAPDSPIVQAAQGIDRFFDTPVAQKTRALRRKIEELDATHPGAPLRAMVLVDKPSPVEPVIFKRGNAGNHGPRVPRQFPALVAGPNRKPFTDGSGRLELARVIASRQNPLTARVLVNRVWGRFLGTPLIKTPADFGVRTEPALNPALLDHLAVRFMDQGWSLKQLARDIVLSATYRQSSDPSPQARKDAYAQNDRIDPANAWHWRMERKRFDFEGLRDSLLFVSGSLDQTVGGQPVEMFEEKSAPRRTLYGFIDRQNLPGILRSFDFASPDTSAPQRFQTTVPQQALFMMNNPFILETARAATRQPDFTRLDSDEARVRHLYQHAFQRNPAPAEIRLAREFVQAQSHVVPEPRPAATWSYGTGRFDPVTARVVDFTPFPKFKDKESRWQAADEFPAKTDAGFASLSAANGHPGRSQAFSVIRRWQAPAPLQLVADGELHHPTDAGDGVRARLVSDRQGVLGEWTARNARTATRSKSFQVQTGERLDFIVDILESDNSDSFNWAPTLTSTDISVDAGPRRTWDAKRDFRGRVTDPKPLDPWAKYAQVLLSSNEFVFVD